MSNIPKANASLRELEQYHRQACEESKNPIEELTKAIINGPINTTVYYIWKYLQQGHTEAAQIEYQRDGDKIYKEFREPLKKILGCRLHLKQNCNGPFCK